MAASLSAVARHFSFVRETEGPNHGYWVAYILGFTGNAEGDSWCASFVSLCDHIATKGAMRVARTASTITMLSRARFKGQVVSSPAVDDLVFSVRADGTPHHVGIVTNVSPLTSIAGNTSADGVSSNGDGVYEHEISAAGKVFVRLPA